MFEDVVEDFHSLDCIKSHFEVWRREYADCYRDAYIGLCLPKLFNPLVRLQLITWNPLEVKDVYDFSGKHFLFETGVVNLTPLAFSFFPFFYLPRPRRRVQISSTCSGSSLCCSTASRSTVCCREGTGISAYYLLLWRRSSSPS